MWSAPTCSAGSKRLGSQRAGAKLAVGRHLRPTERGIGLEWRRGSSSSSQRGLCVQTGRQNCKRNHFICNLYICLKISICQLLNPHAQTLKDTQTLRLHIMWFLPGQWQGPEAESLVVLGAHTQSDPWCHCPGRWYIRRLHLGEGLVALLGDPQCQKNVLEGGDTAFWDIFFFSRSDGASFNEENHTPPQNWEPVSKAGKSQEASYLKKHFNKPTTHT